MSDEEIKNIAIATKKKVKGSRNKEAECMKCGEPVYYHSTYDEDINFICKDCFIKKLLNDEFSENFKMDFFHKLDIEEIREFTGKDDLTEKDVKKNVSQGFVNDILEKAFKRDENKFQKALKKSKSFAS